MIDENSNKVESIGDKLERDNDVFYSKYMKIPFNQLKQEYIESRKEMFAAFKSGDRAEYNRLAFEAMHRAVVYNSRKASKLVDLKVLVSELGLDFKHERDLVRICNDMEMDLSVFKSPSKLSRFLSGIKGILQKPYKTLQGFLE
jgi:hypothetical protein